MVRFAVVGGDFINLHSLRLGLSDFLESSQCLEFTEGGRGKGRLGKSRLGWVVVKAEEGMVKVKGCGYFFDFGRLVDLLSLFLA